MFISIERKLRYMFGIAAIYLFYAKDFLLVKAGPADNCIYTQL